MEGLNIGSLLFRREEDQQRDPTSLLLISEQIEMESNPSKHGKWLAAWAIEPDGNVRMYSIKMLKLLYTLA
jgi:hypothetical protein